MKKMYYLSFMILLFVSCKNQEPIENITDPYEIKEYVKVTHPEWAKNAVIYQLNTRQFSPEGTFAAAAKDLPRIKALGCDIIWLMPIHPIGELNRKGTLGSPYAVKDYFGVNPEFGTIDDLKDFVKQAHALGMYVILDWVANHTAWDNDWVTQHPEWYERDYKGDFRPTPWWDWSDIINLDYNQRDMREKMTEAMKFWVSEADIDGYRCDVAGFIPTDFWNQVRLELDAIKPVFMLAEWESKELHEYAFDMSYAWSWNEKMHAICTGKADVNQLYVYYSWNESAFPKNIFRMTFTSNHDMNSWEGTMWEQFGEGTEAAVVLSIIGEGMPLIYNGQEAGESKRLAFFEKDSITWQYHPIEEVFKKSIALMKNNTALWHAKWGATMIKVPNSAENQVLSFVRANDQDKVFAVFNFSSLSQSIDFNESIHFGTYKDYFTDEKVTCNEAFKLQLPPWGYKVFVKN
jgi:1,4-alpha-glucan branching enzyme